MRVALIILSIIGYVIIYFGAQIYMTRKFGKFWCDVVQTGYSFVWLIYVALTNGDLALRIIWALNTLMMAWVTYNDRHKRNKRKKKSAAGAKAKAIRDAMVATVKGMGAKPGLANG